MHESRLVRKYLPVNSYSITMHTLLTHLYRTIINVTCNISVSRHSRMSCVWRLVSLLALLSSSAPVTTLDSALLARLLAPPPGEPGLVETGSRDHDSHL